MDAPRGFCALCGKPSAHAHHLTGRRPDGEQLHDQIVADLCFQHHVLIHNDLRIALVDTPPSEWSILTRIEYVLRRVAAFIGRYAERADNPIWNHVARLLEQCASEIGTLPTASKGATA